MATATPFPTRDPRLLQIIANVMYALPPAPPAHGGAGVLDPQDDGTQARRPEIPRPGRGDESRGEVSRPARGGEARGDESRVEVPRPGRGEEARGDEPRGEASRPARGGEARGDELRGEVPRPARGGEARGDESRVEVPRPGRGDEVRGFATREDLPRPGCGGDGRRFAFAPRVEVPRSGRGEEVRGFAPRQDVPRPGCGGDGRRFAFAPRVEVPRPGHGEEGRGVAPRQDVPRPGCGGDGRRFAFAPRVEVPRPGRGEEVRGSVPREDVPRPGRGGDGRRLAFAPRAEVPGPGWEGRGVAPRAEVLGPGGEGRGVAPLPQYSSRSGSKILEGLPCLGGQEREAQGAKAMGSTSQYDKDNRVDIITSVGLRQGFVRSSLAPGGLLHEEVNKNQGSDLGSMPPELGCTGWADCQALPTLDAQGKMTIIHDLQFGSISRISEALLNAKGPISLLRLDTIVFDSEQLESLFKLLVASKVEEVILVNRTWPQKSLEFPINSTDNTGILRLRICFFKISEIFASEFDNLLLLDIAHCLIKSEDLKNLVLKCKRLRELHLGYYHEDLYLRSQTLVILQIWYSEINVIEIEHAPELKKITVSAVPKRSQKLLLVRIDNSPDLQTMVGNISNQAISFKCHDIRRGTSLMPNLKNLYIGVCLSMVNERKYLLNVFKCFNRLKKLTLWRMDDVPSTEADNALVDDWSEEIKACEVVNHLHYLKMEGFKGGEYELSIASGFLKYSSSLRHLLIVSDKEDSLQRAQNAFEPPAHVTVIYQKSLVSGI
ncbi:uncharacterized protein [Lolium perenne]|uniref:uncharacterized protein n=1 Tax=Lolium perenne TaxID=4522 RepID=UPI0021F5E000|nr:uncharacterized protein LOC127299349 [Lolium perenne]